MKIEKQKIGVITKKYVTLKYKSLAKIMHPDKKGDKETFQDMKNAYNRIIEYLEKNDEKDEEADFETEFFKKHNFLKKCSTSYVVYIQKQYTDCWKKILEKHIVFQKFDEIGIIFKTGIITITLYPNPKKDPRPKLHIQSRDQSKNLEFILEKLSLFYREVCEMKGNERQAITYKDIERSLCGKCGKTFSNKRGLKQHILRIHTSVKKVTDKTITEITLKEDASNGTYHEETAKDSMSYEVVDVETPRTITEPTDPHKNERDEPCSKNMEDATVVENIIEDLFEKCISSENEHNYQCGVCGKLFKTEKDSQAHIDTEHEDRECRACNRKDNLRKTIEEQKIVIKELAEKNNNLVKKNEALDKENKRGNLALNECMLEKETIRKQLNSQSETLNDIIKQNSTLNEELKTKNELINILNEDKNIDNAVMEEDRVQHHKDDGDDETQEAQGDGWVKCSECDFKTAVRKYLKSHMIAHHEGQYQCQRGCRDKFKTWSNLDDHHNKKHSIKQFNCNTCDSAFKTKENLDEHNRNKHVETYHKCDVCENTFISRESLNHHMENRHNNKTGNACEKCGLILKSMQEMQWHKRECHMQFMKVRNKICKYFIRGRCLKGNTCIFTHKENKQQEFTPVCRNGPQCRYLTTGGCKYYHSRYNNQQNLNNEAQKPQQFYKGVNNRTFQGRSWCRFLEDCYRVPNCAYKHYEENFPKLQKKSYNSQQNQNNEAQKSQQFNDGVNTRTFQGRPWCRFLEDCNRVPNCPYKHYEEVFPKLQKTNNIPIGRRNRN